MRDYYLEIGYGMNTIELCWPLSGDKPPGGVVPAVQELLHELEALAERLTASMLIRR